MNAHTHEVCQVSCDTTKLSVSLILYVDGPGQRLGRLGVNIDTDRRDRAETVPIGQFCHFLRPAVTQWWATGPITFTSLQSTGCIAVCVPGRVHTVRVRSAHVTSKVPDKDLHGRCALLQFFNVLCQVTGASHCYYLRTPAPARGRASAKRAGADQAACRIGRVGAKQLDT